MCRGAGFCWLNLGAGSDVKWWGMRWRRVQKRDNTTGKEKEQNLVGLDERVNAHRSADEEECGRRGSEMLMNVAQRCESSWLTLLWTSCNLSALNSRFILQRQVLTSLLTVWLIPLKPSTPFDQSKREIHNVTVSDCIEKYLQGCNLSPTCSFTKLWNYQITLQ